MGSLMMLLITGLHKPVGTSSDRRPLNLQLDCDNHNVLHCHSMYCFQTTELTNTINRDIFEMCTKHCTIRQKSIAMTYEQTILKNNYSKRHDLQFTLNTI